MRVLLTYVAGDKLLALLVLNVAEIRRTPQNLTPVSGVTGSAVHAIDLRQTYQEWATYVNVVKIDVLL